MPALLCWRPDACPSILGLKKKRGGAEKRENQITFSEWLCKASEALRRACFTQNRSAGDAPLALPLSLVMKRDCTPMRIISRSFSDSRRHRRGINNLKANFVMGFFFWSVHQCLGKGKKMNVYCKLRQFKGVYSFYLLRDYCGG